MGDLLVSGTALEKTARFVFGLFLLCAFLLPLRSAVVSFGELVPDNADNTEISGDTQVMEISLIEERLSRLAEDKLAENGIDGAECSAVLVCEDGAIKRIDCLVYLPRETTEKHARAEEIIRTELGFNPISNL